MSDPPRHRSDWGPTDGPVRWRDCGHALAVVHPDTGERVGMAMGGSWIADLRGPIKTFRLWIGGAYRPGFYILDGREFHPVEEWSADCCRRSIAAGIPTDLIDSEAAEPRRITEA